MVSLKLQSENVQWRNVTPSKFCEERSMLEKVFSSMFEPGKNGMVCFHSFNEFQCLINDKRILNLSMTPLAYWRSAADSLVFLIMRDTIN